MSEETLTKILSFSSRINSDGKIDCPDEKLRDLYNSGFSDVNVVISGSVSRASELRGNDPLVFDKIVKIQGLPENIALEFLNSKSALSETDFEKRVNY